MVRAHGEDVADEDGQVRNDTVCCVVASLRRVIFWILLPQHLEIGVVQLEWLFFFHIGVDLVAGHASCSRSGVRS